jgi:hypothetical protein
MLTVFVGMEKAFDKIWKAGLHQCGVKGNNVRIWISQYIQSRKARVQVRGQHSRKKMLGQGVHQGGVFVTHTLPGIHQ